MLVGYPGWPLGHACYSDGEEVRGASALAGPSYQLPTFPTHSSTRSGLHHGDVMLWSCDPSTGNGSTAGKVEGGCN